MGSLCNEEHPVCFHMFSKEAAIKNEVLWMLLYTPCCSWTEPNDQLLLPEENVCVILSEQMKVPRHPHTCCKDEGNIFQLWGIMSGHILYITKLKKKFTSAPFWENALMKCTQAPALQNHQMCVFAFHKVACTNEANESELSQGESGSGWSKG